ncbi:hypothetical protein ACFL14_02040 [Patescibacteria group bacterium]
MKKLTRQSLYILLSALIILLIAGGIVLVLGRTANLGNDSMDDETIEETNNTDNQTNNGSENLGFVNDSNLSGGKSGEYYYLQDVLFDKKVDFDRVEIQFIARGKSENIPAYNLQITDSLVSIVFSDTSDFDINKSVSTFEGEKKQSVEGWNIQEIVLNYPKDDSSLQIDIDCIGADFGYRVQEENLKLIIDIK